MGSSSFMNMVSRPTFSGREGRWTYVRQVDSACVGYRLIDARLSALS